MSNNKTVYCVVRSCAGAGGAKRKREKSGAGAGIGSEGGECCDGSDDSEVTACHEGMSMLRLVSVLPA